MSYDQEQNLFVVHETLTNLLELVEQVAAGTEPEYTNQLEDEAKAVLFGVVAAILVADGKMDDDEEAFVRGFVDTTTRPDGVYGFIREYAERWESDRHRVPRFLKAARKFDADHGTDLATSMLCEIQLAANTAAIANARLRASETHIIRDYLTFLDEHPE